MRAKEAQSPALLLTTHMILNKTLKFSQPQFLLVKLKSWTIKRAFKVPTSNPVIQMKTIPFKGIHLSGPLETTESQSWKGYQGQCLTEQEFLL